jgi:hypothetical protein
LASEIGSLTLSQKWSITIAAATAPETIAMMAFETPWFNREFGK